MTDSLQSALHVAAIHSVGWRNIAVFLGNDLIVVAFLAFLVLLWTLRRELTRAWLARVVLSAAVALLLVQVLGHTVSDPRPYLADHYAPLAHVSADNGFPSDHTLVMALIAGWVSWISRRWWPVFAVAVVGVALGRLAIGAHHTLDVLGSVVIAVLSLAVASLWRLPPTWQGSLLKQPSAVNS